MKRAAKRKIKNVHAVLDSGVNRVEDVLAAGVINGTRKDVVVTQPCARRYARHVIDAHAVHDGGLSGHPRRVPSDMRPVVLDSLSVQTLLARFVVEDLGNNYFFRDVSAVLVRSMRGAV